MHPRAQIDVEIDDLWNKCVEGGELERSPMRWILDELEAEGEEFEDRAASALQPWTRIFEEGIAWLLLLHQVLYRSQDDSDDSRRNAAAIALTGLAVREAAAVRRLVTNGLDAPARRMLRALLETTQVLLALLADPRLASAYCEHADGEAAEAFWGQHFADGRLEKRTARVEREVFQHIGASDDDALHLGQWRRELQSLLDQELRPSFASGLRATSASIDGSGSAWDDRRHMLSVNVLDCGIKVLHYLSQLSLELIEVGSEGSTSGTYIPVSATDAHEVLLSGRTVYDQLVRRYWDAAMSTETV